MHKLHLSVLAILLAALSPLSARACPFCSAVSITLGEELKGASAAVVATLEELPPQPAPAADGEPAPISDSKAKFKIANVLKGQEILGDKQIIEVTYFGQDEKGKPFLIMGVDQPEVVWNTPIPLTERAVEYVGKLPSLPESGPDRLAYFQNYFEDPEEMLARDAYDEFAKAPYAEVKGLKDRMNREQLVTWIQNPEVIPSRRRLYLTMLGICGTKDDLPMLEKIVQSDDREMKTALDAVVACHLTLAGPDGLPLIEDKFLKNKDAEYTDTYAAIMALRFHGQEESVIPKDRLVKSLEYMLDRPNLADLVIPDLARWEDWGVTDRLVKLFKEADEETSWVRVPVINFLKACPLPEAKQHIEELAQIDPDAVKRANSAFPFAGAAPVPTPTSEPDATTVAEESGEAAIVESTPEAEVPVSEQPEAAEVATSTPSEANEEKKDDATAAPAVAQSSGPNRPTAALPAPSEPLVEPSPYQATPAWIVVAAPVAVGAVLLGIFVFVLRGQRRQANT